MNVIFEDEELDELFNNRKSKKYKKIAQNVVLYNCFARVINTLMGAYNCAELSQYSFLHYEKLKHEFSGKSSVRLSNSHVERLIFTETDDGVTVNLIEIDSTHYGNKK